MMVFYDAIGDGKPQACPFSHRFGREKGVENFIYCGVGNAAAVISKADIDHAFVKPSFDPDSPFTGNGLDRIVHDVHVDLVH